MTSEAMPEREPVEVYCLAEYPAEEMEARGWTAWDVAARMSDKRSLAHRVLYVSLLLCCQEDSILLADKDFVQLGTAFGVSSEMLKGLHETWKAWPDRRSPFECPEHLLPDLEPPANDQ